MKMNLGQWFQTFGPEINQLLCKHLVSLRWIHGLKEPRSDTGDLRRDLDVTFEERTAFLVESKGCWFMITAGHVLQWFVDSVSGDRQYQKAQLHCSWHRDEDDQVEPVAIALDQLPYFIADVEKLGVDYGAVPLDDPVVKGLHDAGCAPVPEQMWADNTDKFDLCVLMGFPKERRTKEYTTSGTKTNLALGMFTPLLPLQQIDDPPEGMEKACDSFYGKILQRRGKYKDEEIWLLDIDGMSGGPVFGLHCHPEGFTYRLIGVQSWWREEEQIAVSCRIRQFGEHVGTVMKEAIDAIE